MDFNLPPRVFPPTSNGLLNFFKAIGKKSHENKNGKRWRKVTSSTTNGQFPVYRLIDLISLIIWLHYTASCRQLDSGSLRPVANLLKLFWAKLVKPFSEVASTAAKAMNNRWPVHRAIFFSPGQNSSRRHGFTLGCVRTIFYRWGNSEFHKVAGDESSSLVLLTGFSNVWCVGLTKVRRSQS